jgi:hypothetical protein
MPERNVGGDGHDANNNGGPSSTSETALAKNMEIETQFLIKLCQSCVGLVESVPSYELQKAAVYFSLSS